MIDPTMCSEYERYVNSDFVTHLHPKEFATFDVLDFWKEKDTMFPFLSRMAMDIISVQASSVGSKSHFKQGFTWTAKSVQQSKALLERPLDFDEEVLVDEVQRNECHSTIQ
ncbi:zinc finger BED domain-containing protein RICESLEEPER 2 [Tanacetum coccineum]